MENYILKEELLTLSKNVQREEYDFSLQYIQIDIFHQKLIYSK